MLLADIFENFFFSDESPNDLILRNSNQKEQTFVCCTPQCYLLLAAVMASLGGVLFGYDVGR